MTDSALVLFSGGQDSTTCLAWALARYSHVETVGFHYGQRHAVEMDVREQVREGLRGINAEWSGRLGDDHILDLGALGQISDTALTKSAAIQMTKEGLPNTFVPARNLLFLTFAAALAYRRDIKRLVTGVCETDYSGYPDCRDDTIKALQVAINLGTERRFVIDTPLMWVDKAGTWSLAQALAGDALVDLIRRETHTCYMGVRERMHDWGVGCGECPACDLRSKGWKEYTNAPSILKDLPACVET